MSRTVVFVLASLMASGVSSVSGAGGLGAGRPGNRRSTDAAGAPTGAPADHADERAAEASRCRGRSAVGSIAGRDPGYRLRSQCPVHRGQALESGREPVRHRQAAQLRRQRRQSRDAVRRPADRHVSRPDGAHDPAQQAAEGYDLSDQRRQHQHPALLQRHQHAYPWIVDQSVGQQRQRADLGQSAASTSSTSTTSRPIIRRAPSGIIRTATARPRCRSPAAWPAR